ncbi:uncharacterized protein VTP21DRAFT_9173 [Calcarisporiella thermophila]|uniref:uncharacterized protein n=1 Tax=Calcarisporiella thermophila TaxID=911321 RepID=UPI0037436A45
MDSLPSLSTAQFSSPPPLPTEGATDSNTTVFAASGLSPGPRPSPCLLSHNVTLFLFGGSRQAGKGSVILSASLPISKERVEWRELSAESVRGTLSETCAVSEGGKIVVIAEEGGQVRADTRKQRLARRGPMEGLKRVHKNSKKKKKKPGKHDSRAGEEEEGGELEEEKKNEPTLTAAPSSSAPSPQPSSMPTPAPSSAPASDVSIHVYDIQTQRWDTSKSDQETLRNFIGRTHYAAVSLGADLYYYGGRIGGCFTDMLLVYNLENKTWRRVVGAPIVWYPSLVAIQGKLVIFGSLPGEGTWLNVAYQYNPSAQK